MQNQPTKIKIRHVALTLLKTNPEGLRYKDLHRTVCKQLPGVSPNTVASEIHTLRHSLLPGLTVEKGHYHYSAP